MNTILTRTKLIKVILKTAFVVFVVYAGYETYKAISPSFQGVSILVGFLICLYVVKLIINSLRQLISNFITRRTEKEQAVLLVLGESLKYMEAMVCGALFYYAYTVNQRNAIIVVVACLFYLTYEKIITALNNKS
ncbi:hypothetical protein MAH1_37090 [Sessilibacter sp. MAH1]